MQSIDYANWQVHIIWDAVAEYWTEFQEGQVLFPACPLTTDSR